MFSVTLLCRLLILFCHYSQSLCHSMLWWHCISLGYIMPLFSYQGGLKYNRLSHMLRSAHCPGSLLTAEKCWYNWYIVTVRNYLRWELYSYEYKFVRLCAVEGFVFRSIFWCERSGEVWWPEESSHGGTTPLQSKSLSVIWIITALTAATRQPLCLHRGPPLHCQYLEDTPHSSSHSKHNGPKYCPGLTTFYISFQPAMQCKNVDLRNSQRWVRLMIFLTWSVGSNCWPGSRLGRMREERRGEESLLYCGSGGREEWRQGWAAS